MPSRPIDGISPALKRGAGLARGMAAWHDRAVDQPAPAGDQETRWLKDSLAATARELRAFAETAAAATVRPARFARGWVEGRQAALNPLAFMATAAALVTVAATLAARLGPLHGSSTLAGEVLDSLGPYLHYLALGLICHAILRLAGSRRSLAGSVAMSLYVGGGPGTIATLVDLVMFLVLVKLFGKVNFSAAELATPAVMAAGAVVWAVRLGMVVAFVAAFAGLHQVRVGWAVLGLGVALLLTGVAFGVLAPPGRYGMHLAIGHLHGGRRLWWPAVVPM
jgi:hypothetical protein